MLATPPDVEKKVIDFLISALLARSEDVTVGINVPPTWTTTTKPHILVALDGTVDIQYPITAAATIRVTSWSSSPSTAKRLANLCQGLLISTGAISGIASIQALTGVLPAKDNATSAQLASVTVRVNVRFTAL